ncbi:MAG: DUF2244 domain-containing protein [Halioglobus sp.]
MVNTHRTDEQLTIVVRPNHSSSWRNNLIALMAISVPSLGAAVGFTLVGAWPILPFAGLELLALGSALYYVNWKLQYRHVITLNETSVKIDKGHYYPKRSWRFSREGSGLSITPEQHPWDGPEVNVHDRGEIVRVGEFLNREDAQQLASLLRKEMRVDSISGRSKQSF